MGARLLIRYVEGRPVEDELAYPFDQFRVVVGRSAAADVRLPHRTVSDRHATIEQSAGTYKITDHGSTNGSRINGEALVPHRARRLKDGDRLELGVYEVTFHEGVLVTEPLCAERSAEFARRLLRTQAATEPPRLVVVSGPQTGSCLHLKPAPEKFSIGSGDDDALSIVDQSVQSGHVELQWTPAGVQLECPDGAAYITWAGKRLRNHLLRDGEEIQVGRTSVFYEEPAEALLTGLDGADDEAHTYGTYGDRSATAAPTRRSSSRPPPATRKARSSTPPSASGSSHTTQQSSGMGEAPPTKSAPSSPAGAADLLVFGLAGVMLTISIAALIFLLRAH